MRKIAALASVALVLGACSVDTAGLSKGSALGVGGGRREAPQQRTQDRREVRRERQREARQQRLRDLRRQRRADARVAARAAAAAESAAEEQAAAVVAASSCGYDPCLAPASDYDCAGGSGDGPAYTGPVKVTGSDPYDLDSDGDGWGCEPT